MHIFNDILQLDRALEAISTPSTITSLMHGAYETFFSDIGVEPKNFVVHPKVFHQLAASGSREIRFASLSREATFFGISIIIDAKMPDNQIRVIGNGQFLNVFLPALLQKDFI